jgi:hypothetical protein
MCVEAEAVRVEGGALDRLYRLHIDHAFRLAYLLTGNRALAEERAQDAFMKVAGRLLHLRRPGDFGAYLGKVVNVIHVPLGGWARADSVAAWDHGSWPGDQDGRPAI